MRPTTLPRTAALALCLLGAAGCSEYEGPDEAPDGVDPIAGDPLAGGSLEPVGDDGVPADDDPAARPFAPADVPGDTRNVAGLYDASIARPLGLDVRYVLITSDGTFTLFDYDLDPYGTGLNCFRDGRPRALVRERGDDYLLDGRSVRVARETLGIGFGYTDTLDDDRDGDTSDFVYYRYPRVPGLSALDLAPCR